MPAQSSAFVPKSGLIIHQLLCQSLPHTSHLLLDGSKSAILNIFIRNLCNNYFVYSWNEWINLPMKYCDLPRNAQLCLTIYECCGPGKYIPVGGTSLPLFGKLGVYKQVIFCK